jgi:cell division FtsZ-interacting protein ZapD
MALTETKVIDKIEVVENGTLQVREATRILKDGEQIAQTYHRWSFAPGSDISAMPANVQAIAQAAWTPEVIAAYEAQQAANQIGAE